MRTRLIVVEKNHSPAMSQLRVGEIQMRPRRLDTSRRVLRAGDPPVAAAHAIAVNRTMPPTPPMGSASYPMQVSSPPAKWSFRHYTVKNFLMGIEDGMPASAGCFGNRLL